MPVRAILAVALLVALVGCGARTPEPTATPAATPTVSVPDRPPKPTFVTVMDAGPEFIGFTSLEERIFHADVIARAKLRSLRGSALRNGSWSSKGYWIPVITFEFEALELLKGEAGGSLLVYASFGGSGNSSQSRYEVYESKSDAIAAALYRISVRDESWDEREAIVFVSSYHYWSDESYHFTLSGDIQAPEYRLESRYNRVWLPAADDTSELPERYLMTGPRPDLGSEGGPWGAAPWGFAQESITLEELQKGIAELDASISRAEAEGISGYSTCLASSYEHDRKNQQAIYEGGKLIPALVAALRAASSSKESPA